jgi:DNA-damage-inducible protein J
LTGWIQAQISHGQSSPVPAQILRAALMPPACTRGKGMLRSIHAEFVGVSVEVGLTPAARADHPRYNVSQLINKELVMAATSMVHVRVDEHIKAQATETLAAMGLSVSDAVRVFLTRVVAEQQLPFALKAPNADTRAAMAEARTISKARFASAKTLIVDLEKGTKR